MRGEGPQSSPGGQRTERYDARWGKAGHGVVLFDRDLRILWGNEALGAMLGVTLAEWEGRDPFSFVHPDDLDRAVHSFQGLESHLGRRGPALYRVLANDGTPRLVVVSGLNLLDDPDWDCLALEIRDLDDDERAQALTNDEYAVLERLVHGQTLAETLLDIAVLVERHGDRGDCAISLLDDGRLRVAAAPNLPDDLVAAIDGTPALAGHLTMGEAVHQVSEVVSPDLLTDPLWTEHRELVAGHRYRSCWSVPVLAAAGPGDGEKPEVLGSVDFFRSTPGEPEIGEWALYVLAARLAGLAVERARFVERLEHQATHDPLTGLLNRNAFVDALDALHADGPRSVAVLFVDLDRFKVVNDTHGHELGDRLLCEVSARLAELSDQGATVARIGGDEFVVAWPDVTVPGTALKLAERARSLVAEPFELGLLSVRTTASVGAATGTLGRDAPEQLVRDADAALYRAKATGRNRAVFFDDGLRAAHRTRRDTERDLRGAAERDELEVHYQPVVDLATGEVVAVEALARWQHPVHGLRLPAAFIGVAEDAGLIVEIDRWVVATALRTVERWNRDRGTFPLGLWVNISAVHLARADTVAAYTALSRSHRGVPLGVEITESAIHADDAEAGEKLAALRSVGLSVAVDDFGTGYSSLGSLRSFPVTHLKVDKGFVEGMLSNAHDRAIVEASIMLAGAIGLTVTAEGIESREQARALADLGCGRGQGFLYSRPMAAADLDAAFGPGLTTSFPPLTVTRSSRALA